MTYLSYVFSIPFVSALNFSTVLIYPVLTSAICFLIKIFAVSHGRAAVIPSLKLVFFCVVWPGAVLVSSILSLNATNYLHLISYIAVPCFYLLFPSIFLKTIRISSIQAVVMSGSVLLGLFSIVEFVTNNFFSFKLYVYRPRVEEFEALFFGLYRSRSVFEEPGHYASFLMIVLPILMLSKNLFKTFYFLLTIVLVGFAVTFSIAGFLYLIVFMAGYLVFVLRRSYAFIILFCIFISILIGYQFILEAIASVYNLKIGSGSLPDRISRLHQNEVDISNSVKFIMLGLGPGSYKYYGFDSSLSAFINVFRDLGLVGLALFLWPYLYSIYRVITAKLPLDVRYYLVSANVAPLYFMLLIPNYFFPQMMFPALFTYLFLPRKNFCDLLNSSHNHNAEGLIALGLALKPSGPR